MKNDAGTKMIRATIQRWKRFKDVLPTELGNMAKNHFVQSFRTQGFEDEALVAWTPRKRRDEGRATLVKSGNLRRSIRIAYATWAKTSVISDTPYSSIHNYGQYGLAWGKIRFKMPQRKFMGLSDALNRKSLLHIRKKMFSVFR